MVGLLLVRHGPAAERDPRRWPDDADRPLHRAGILETKRAAQGLATLSPDAARVVSSPAVRAARTAEIVRAALGLKRAVATWEELAPDAPAAPLLARFADEAKPGRVPILVGHEPTLGELVGYALTGDAVSLVRLGRAGAVVIDFSRSVVPGAGQLSWMMTRKQLAGLAD